MKEVLIIGGTQTFGKELALSYQASNYEVHVIGRSKPHFETASHIVCDMENKQLRQSVFEKYILENNFETIACVVGYAREENQCDLQKSYELNIGYVEDVLALSPKSNIITIGSRWSLMSNTASLKTYSNHKQQLRKLTIDYAHTHPQYRTNQYCVPTMNTNQFRKVQQSFGEEKKNFEQSNNNVLDPKDIANTIVEYEVNQKPHAQTLWVPVANKVDVIN